MNNSQIASEYLETDAVDNIPIYQQQAKDLGEILEALEKISQSNYWKVIDEKIFSGELHSLKNLLSKEKDTVEIYRLQGQITRAEKYDFSKMISDTRNKLLNIKNKIK